MLLVQVISMFMYGNFYFPCNDTNVLSYAVHISWYKKLPTWGDSYHFIYYMKSGTDVVC